MGIEVIYKDMPERIKAFSVENDDGTNIIVINKKWGKENDKEATKKILLSNKLRVQ